MVHTLQEVELTLASGRLRGVSLGSVHRFLSVPYAAPVSGRGRFERPSPVSAWEGIRDATVSGPTAPQPDRSRFGTLDVNPFFAPGWVHGDDYLTLNIWAPADADGSAPVLAYVHGGGFVAGSASAPAYDGAAFARDGVVFVGINYRLGAPGFLAVQDAPDNRGVLDIIEALRWVSDNIASFGADPSEVTVAGQSAGAVLVAGVLCEPSAEGLMRRSIVQSGTGTGAFTPEQGEIVSAALSAQLDTVATIDGLSRVSDHDFVAATSQLSDLSLATSSARPPIGDIVRFGPILARQPAEMIANSWGRNVDLLIGTNLDEAGLYLAPLGRLDTVLAADVENAAGRFVQRPETLVEAYRSAFPDAANVELMRTITGDGMFGTGSRRFADQHSSDTGSTHVYEFTWRPDTIAGLLGASHLMELPFVFDGLNVAGLRGAESLLGSVAPPPELASRLHATWVDFVKGRGPGWPGYRPDTSLVQQIGTEWQLRSGHNSELYAAWEGGSR